MTLTTAQQVRLRIQDQTRAADVVFYGDGTAVRFGLEQTNISSGTAYVGLGNPPTAWSATGCTFNTTGWVEFSAIFSANTPFRATYTHSVFSEDEIGHFTAVGGNVVGAALEACRTLMFDSLKRARWMSPDGSQYDDTQAMNYIQKLEWALKNELEESAIAGGSIHSWALEQENYD